MRLLLQRSRVRGTRRQRPRLPLQLQESDPFHKRDPCRFLIKLILRSSFGFLLGTFLLGVSLIDRMPAFSLALIMPCWTRTKVDQDEAVPGLVLSKRGNPGTDIA